MASVMSCLQAFAKFPSSRCSLESYQVWKHWNIDDQWGGEGWILMKNLIANKIGSCITGKIFREFGKPWNLWQLHDIHAENDLDLQIYNDFMQRMLKDYLALVSKWTKYETMIVGNLFKSRKFLKIHFDKVFPKKTV